VILVGRRFVTGALPQSEIHWRTSRQWPPAIEWLFAGCMRRFQTGST